MLGKAKVKSKRVKAKPKGQSFLIFTFGFYFLVFSFYFLGCAKEPVKIAGLNMPSGVSSFRGLAYVVAERDGVKWANNVSIFIKTPNILRIEALERLADVVAVLDARDGNGSLKLPLENKIYPLKNALVRLPMVGEIDMRVDELADVLIGRPKTEGGAMVSESFHTLRGSYFIKGAEFDVEMSSVEKMPLVLTKYSDQAKKHVNYEIDFNDFISTGGHKFPKHIVIRFTHPKLLMEIKYKEIKGE